MRTAKTIVLGLGLALATAGAASAGCLDEVERLETQLDQQRERAANASGSNGPTVVEGGKTTTYAEGGPAQPAESWFGDPQKGKAVEERLIAARSFAEQGDEEACQEQVDKVRSLIEPGR
jgi:hypothetical protein